MKLILQPKIRLGFIVLAICLMSQNAVFAQGIIEKRLAARKTLPDQGIRNEVHKAHIGQIVWSNEKIDFENPDASKFKTNFTTDEWIYGRFYLSESMQNSIRKEKKEVFNNFYYYFDLYVDGVKMDWKVESGELYGEYLQRTSQQVWVCTEEGSDRAEWKKLVNSLKPGIHEFKLDLKAKSNYKEFDIIFATGSFKLTINPGDKVNIGKSFSTYKAGMEDKEVESRILTCIQEYAKKSGWKETFTGVKIQNEDWTILQNVNTGVTTGRSVVAYCFATWPDGHCTVQRFVFKQQYDGQTYGKSIHYNGLISSSQENIDCE